MAGVATNKAKIARRVIEVLDFFDEDHPQATVMDIVRRFDRPQSSTSELLASLVDLGMLYKDPYTRSYSPTPRAAMLASSVQPTLVRDGDITKLTDRLVAQTGLGIALFGMVGLKVQIWNWRSGKKPIRAFENCGFSGGRHQDLSASAAGWLLLSTIENPRRDGMIRRLNAEAESEEKFSQADMAARIQQCCDSGHVTGPAGFAPDAQVTARLLPGMPEGQPMAIGFVYDVNERVEPDKLVNTLTDALDRHSPDDDSHASVRPLFGESWNTPELEISRA